ncbi:MAG: N-acetylmuramoyl-L-alanine amidase [Methylacidiphilales bacterium]|nr:N-acetylmuramoyl-L-alanine amidase [Candidatus Methylacidiphilales bacterium]MDW8349725.1 hypothetical protein [Verrucomicrobiae bacterium]
MKLTSERFSVFFLLCWFFIRPDQDTLVAGQNLSPLASPPDWSLLDPYQRTMTQEEFKHLLDTIFAPNRASIETISVNPEDARILVSWPNVENHYRLQFKTADQENRSNVKKYWRHRHELPRAPADKPLKGLHIAIDPGHIGGRWARMEERWFRIGEAEPICEGELTLKVAKLIYPQLVALGARVSLVREKNEPVTKVNIFDLYPAARDLLLRSGVKTPRQNYFGINDPKRFSTVRWQAERLYYRASEIRERARLVNEILKPDVVVCLHFNAEAWGDPSAPRLRDDNHLHLIVNGCYMADELRLDDVRFGMLKKLLNRSWMTEIEASEVVAEYLAEATGLPRYVYKGKNAITVGKSGWVWARNLLANRLYECPVIFLEPYVMNNKEVYARIQAGDYAGELEIAGKKRKSIFREYADAVVAGLKAYYGAR